MNTTVSNLVKDIEGHFVCPGVEPLSISSEVIHQVIQKSVDPLMEE
jgi:hypothetical protein